jgi:hypothetical protein
MAVKLAALWEDEKAVQMVVKTAAKWVGWMVAQKVDPMVELRVAEKVGMKVEQWAEK